MHGSGWGLLRAFSRGGNQETVEFQWFRRGVMARFGMTCTHTRQLPYWCVPPRAECCAPLRQLAATKGDRHAWVWCIAWLTCPVPCFTDPACSARLAPYHPA